MARPPNGSPVWKNGRWWARVTVDGRRRLFEIRPRITDPEAKALAVDRTRQVAEEARSGAEMLVRTADDVLPPEIDVTRHTFAGVYFVRAGDWVKIGHTLDVGARMRDLQTACPLTLRVLAITPGGRKEEQAYHRELRAHRALLGHTDIATTQRYAHLGESALRVAARETAGPAVHVLSTPAGADRESTENQRPRSDLNRRTFGLGSPGDFERDRDDSSVPGRLVDAFVAAVQAGHDARARAASTAMAAELLPLVVAAMTPGPTQIRDGLTLADRLASPALSLPLDTAAGAR